MLRTCSCVIALTVMLVGLPTAQAADPAEAQKHPLEYPMRVARTTVACPSSVIDEQKCSIMEPSQKLFRRTNTIELHGRCRIIPWQDSTPENDAWVDCMALEHTTKEGARAASEFARREREDGPLVERFSRCMMHDRNLPVPEECKAYLKGRADEPIPWGPNPLAPK